MTDQQRRAADPAASVWVSASAGTGKTRVLTNRVLNHLLAGTAPERILCLTFTKAAAAEMEDRIAGTLAEWATCGEQDLRTRLRDLAGKPPASEITQRARRLFAVFLDAPGGMKIMTIHAFCQSLLKRFPLEAGLAPHFTVMEERDAAELMDEARRGLLVKVRRQGGALAEALSEVTAHVDERGFAEVMAALARDRSRLRQVVPGGDIGARLRALLGLGPEDTRATILAAGCADDAFDGPALRAAADALRQGGATDAANGAIIGDWLAADPARRTATFDNYLTGFFTQTGDRRAKLIHKEAQAIASDAEAALVTEVVRLDALRERLRAATIVAATTAILELGAALLDIYSAQKAARAFLDYDDLILGARDLLHRRASAAWVLYKLDGGIDHILIDEAQDTNPEQWEVVRILAEEFFAGEGARDQTRTLFAVGDAKQSIFSFQRAAPDEFEAMRKYFSERAAAAEQSWADVPLDKSFRSTKAVLDLVDTVFADATAGAGVVPPGEALKHRLNRTGQAGLVEIWPLAPQPDKDESAAWTLPIEQKSVTAPEARLAGVIAARIAGWIENGETLESLGRPVRAGDIMILVPRRRVFVEQMVWELKQRKIPVAGVDRMVLTEQIAVMDLLALGRFLSLPEDDLNFAALLKSPLCGLSEEQLFDLAYNRSGSLWDALRGQSGNNPVFARIDTELRELLARADFVPPYELYADLLGARGGCHRLLRRLGPEAEDPIDEFLALALSYERAHTPSLQGFLQWVEAGETQIKRELEKSGRDEVRVMTVHGAKGLEAPIVFLPDTTEAPGGPRAGRAPFLWPDGAAGLPLWPPRKEHEDTVAAAARDVEATRRREEYHRLLYVALTRAADRLYVCGWEPRRTLPDDCWYGFAKQGVEGLGEPVADIVADLPGGWPGAGLRYRVTQTRPPEKKKPDIVREDAGAAPVWLRESAPEEPAPPRPLAPSRPAAEPTVRSPLFGADGAVDDGARFRRGLLMHRLLEVLPETAPAERHALSLRYLAAAGRGFAPAVREGIAREALAVLDDPDFAPFFGPGSRAEVPLSGVVGGQVINGQVDRLVVGEDAVLVLDYKSNRPPPRAESEVSDAYLAQMAAYRAILRQVYPDRPVACALLWTDGPRLMRLGDRILDARAP